MRKMIVSLFVSGALVLLFALPSISQTAPAEDITMAYLPKKTVIFKHSAHKELDCKKCHHMWEKEGDPRKCTTSGCHDVFDSKDKTEHNLYKTIHGKGSDAATGCLQCHKEEAKKNKDKKKELTGCAGSYCHP